MDTLQLYRHILRHAKRFPSIKRNKIVEEIRLSFRTNRNESDPDKVKEQLSVAAKGLQQLQMYTSLPKNSSAWTINLEKEPMPVGRGRKEE